MTTFIRWDNWAQTNGSDEPYEVRPGITRWTFGSVDVNLSFGEHVVLEYIQTDYTQRGQGIGSKMMRGLCDAADAVNITIELVADDSGHGWIETWYEKFGFVSGECLECLQ